MKINIKKHKRNTLVASVKNSIFLYNSLKPNQFRQLGKICETIVNMRDYILGKYGFGEEEVFLNSNLLRNYFRQVFDEEIVLILSNDPVFWNSSDIKGGDAKIEHKSYTRSNIAKFIRGEAIHSDSEIANKKREWLHDFAFEKTELFAVFAVTRNWIRLPTICYPMNFDSNNAFVENIRIGKEELEYSLIESIVINIFRSEILSIIQSGKEEVTQAAISFDQNVCEYFRTFGQIEYESVLRQYRKISEICEQ